MSIGNAIACVVVGFVPCCVTVAATCAVDVDSGDCYIGMLLLCHLRLCDHVTLLFTFVCVCVNLVDGVSIFTTIGGMCVAGIFGRCVVSR